LAAGSPVAAILGGLLLNARHLPFGLAVADIVAGDSEGASQRSEERTERGAGRLGWAGDSEGASQRSEERTERGAGRLGWAGDSEGASQRSEERTERGAGRLGWAGDRRAGGRVRRLVGSHLMVDESVAFAMAQGDPARRRAAY